MSRLRARRGMQPGGDSGRRGSWWRAVPVLAGAFLFNLGQGVLRPTMPLYMTETFLANYRMVTAIPSVFGAGKWVASLPTGYALGVVGGRPLMVGGLLVIALSDVASAMTALYAVFLIIRAFAGVGWAMFGTAATTTMVDLPTVERRGRAVSLLMMAETAGLLVGTAAAGWLYQEAGIASPFAFEAACMVLAAVVIGRSAPPAVARPTTSAGPRERRALGAPLRVPGVLVMSLTNAALTAIQTGVLVFLFPLHLVSRADLGPEAVGLLASLSVLGRLLALWVAGGASSRSGRLRALVPGLVVYALVLGGGPFLTHPAALAVWSLGIGAAAGFVAALPTALVGDLTPLPMHGLAIAWLRTLTDGGQVLGPLAMGFLADALGLSAPFHLGAALLLVAAWRCARQTGATSPATAGEGGS